MPSRRPGPVVAPDGSAAAPRALPRMRDSAVVTIALLVSGVLSYGFLAAPARSGRLDPVAYGPLAALWFVVFTVGSGLLVPLEQELTRAVAASGSRTPGQPAPLTREQQEEVTAGVVVGLVPTLALAALVVALQPVIRDRLLAGDQAMVWVLLATLPSLLGFELVRGVLAGSGRFSAYSVVMIVDAAVRFLVAATFVIVGVTTPAHYGAAMAAGMAAATAGGLLWTRLPLRRGTSRRIGAFARRFWGYALSQLLAQLAINSPVLLGVALAGPGEADVAGRVGATLVLVRTPLYLLPALTAPLLPHLADAEATGRSSVLDRILDRAVVIVLVLTAAGSVLAASIGPPLARAVFGSGFAIPALSVGFLTAGAGLFALASVLTVVLLARQQVHWILGSWPVGLALAVATALSVSDLVEAVSASFLVATGCGAAIQLLAVKLTGRGARSHGAAPAPLAP